jgi:hypothetical protein
VTPELRQAVERLHECLKVSGPRRWPESESLEIQLMAETLRRLDTPDNHKIAQAIAVGRVLERRYYCTPAEAQEGAR